MIVETLQSRDLSDCSVWFKELSKLLMPEKKSSLFGMPNKIITDITQRARKFKKVQAKKLVKSSKSEFFRKIAFLAVLNFFPVQNLIFVHF